MQTEIRETVKSSFSEEDKAKLKGSLSKIARKHKCSITYVTMVMNGERNLNTKLSKKISEDLQTLLDFLTPTPEDNV